MQAAPRKGYNNFMVLIVMSSCSIKIHVEGHLIVNILIEILSDEFIHNLNLT